MTWWTCPPVGLHCFQKHHVNFSPAAVAKAPLPPLPLVEVIQMLPAAPRWVCTLFNEQRKQPARKWGLEDPLLHIKGTINWGQMKQCAGVCVYCVRVERHEGHYHKSMPLAYVSTFISIRLPWNQTSFFWIQFTWFLLHRIFFLTFFTLHNDGNHDAIVIIYWLSATSSTLPSAAVCSFISLCCVFLGFAL